MSNIRVLDCTLRDGGYCNQWEFGHQNIIKILESLSLAGINIVECGFLSNNTAHNQDSTIFSDLSQIADILSVKKDSCLYVCMINYGEYSAEDLPFYDGTSVDGIRVAFHKKDVIPALELCRKIKNKGYKVFIQAMVSQNYNDEEFLNLIHLCNEFEPYAFYIVDSFGVMKRKDLMRLYYLVDHNLSKNICIGYHSHNNMQLAYANAQTLVDMKTKRNLIIDSSIFGMGRGAGNLNTELFVEYLNDNVETEYLLHPLLQVIDEVLNDFYEKNHWGYSLPNYLSAAHNAHPNYAGYLDEKKTLTMENMNELFSMMDEEKKVSFDKNYIEELYTNYMATGHVDETRLNELKEKIRDKKVLVIAPGKSISEEREKVVSFASREDVVTFAINFDYKDYPVDFIFVSNLRRFRDIEKKSLSKCIVTSNISSKGTFLQTRYRNLMNDTEFVKDNAGLMLIRYLILLGVKNVYIAGLDGYSVDPLKNFVDDKMTFSSGRKVLESMNSGLSLVLSKMAKEISIKYVTDQKFVKISK